MRNCARLGLCLGVFVFVLVSAGVSHAGDAKNNINLALWGAADSETTAFVGAVEYEREINEKLGVFGRFGFLDYDWDDNENEEKGDGFGGEAGVRYYVSGESKNFFIGGGIGIWGSDWDFTNDEGEPFEVRGDGSSTAINISFDLGYRFQLGDTVSIVPNARLGNYIALDDDCKFVEGAQGESDRETQLGFYGAIGVYLGFTV